MNFAVVSAKGGVGKSTFCVCLGQTLASHGKKTLLVDMDVGVRSLDLLLGVAEKTVYNWGDILSGNCDVKKAIINVSEGLSLLPAPLDYSDSWSEDGLKTFLAELEKEFDFIIADSPAGIGRGFKMSVKALESCIVVSTPDAVSVRAASGAATLARSLGAREIRLVVNRFSKKHGNCCIDDFIDEIGARLLGVVPEAKRLRLITPGQRLDVASREGLAFLRISGRLCGEDIPLKL